MISSNVSDLRLFMLVLGATVPGRHTEQHDIFFTIGANLNELVPDIKEFWNGKNVKVHIDAWRTVTMVDGFEIRVVEKNNAAISGNHLFFLNLGGYKKDEFEEFHYNMLAVAPDMAGAVNISKKTAFYRHTGIKGANSHIDNKYGIDVDNVLKVQDILPARFNDQYSLQILPANNGEEDEVHLGYFKLDSLEHLA